MGYFDFRKLCLLALAAAASGAGLPGCEDELGTIPLTSEVGAVGFKLSVPDGIELSNLTYSVERGGAVVKTSTVVIAGAGTTFAAKIERIPAGAGYTIKLSSDAGAQKCTGSASFDIKQSETTTVAVRLRCPGMRGGDTGTGSLLVEGDLNICPVIDNAIASPNGDGTYQLTASGSDADGAPGPLAYVWTASAGSLSSSSSADTTFTCPAAGGDVTVTLEVNDSDTGCSEVSGTSETLAGITCAGASNTGGTGGSGAGGASGGGALSDGSSPECMTCRGQNCADYQGSGLDMAAGCFSQINTSLGADAADTAFLQDCVDFVKCAQENTCAYGVNGASDCYCGSATPDDCINVGPAADAKCIPETQRAARATANSDIVIRFSDLAYPIGWAYFLLECDSQFCEACKPQ